MRSNLLGFALIAAGLSQLNRLAFGFFTTY